jgi:hypothetical protein
MVGSEECRERVGCSFVSVWLVLGRGEVAGGLQYVGVTK